MINKPLILIIDDDVTLRDMYARRLELEGFSVATATDGEQGLAKAGRLKPAVILLDIMLPGINGYKIAERLKQDPATKPIPILFLSALFSEQERQRAAGYQAASGFLVKSEVTPAEIVSKINTILGRGS